MIPSHRIDGSQFHVQSRLAIARDVAVILLCLAFVVGFLVEFWRAPRTAGEAEPTAPATQAPADPVARSIP